MALPDDDPDDVLEFARGAHVGIVRPEDGFEPRLTTTWHNFLKLVTTFKVSESKVGPYICRPMGGDGSRSDANALPSCVLALDLDELLPEDMARLDAFGKKGLELAIVSTFSHTPENPRIRVWVKCSRPFSAQEHLLLFRAFNQVQVFPFKLDPSTAKPSQPIYLPRVPESRKHQTIANYYPGVPLDVDRTLQGFQKEQEELQRRNERGRFMEGRGVRTPGGMIDIFNKNFKIGELLEAHGYVRKSRSRYKAPGSKSGRAAVLITDEGKVLSYHDPAHDPLAQHNEFHQQKSQDAFGVYTILEHNNDFISSWKAAQKIVRQKGWEVSDEEKERKLEGFKVWSIDDAIDNSAPREMVVEGLLPKGEVVIVTGRSNSGKTTVLEYLALCIATGRHFDSRECEQGPVLWIAGEDAENAKMRVAGMCSEYGINYKSLHDVFYIIQQPIAVLDKASMAAFREAVAEVVGGGQFSAVFMDSKSTCWGGENENSNDENAWFVVELKKMAAEYSAGMVVTHHLTKGGDDDEPTARGASSLINNSDHEWRSVMNATSTVATLEPGTKLRIARWKPIRFGVKVMTLPQADYPKLVNKRGRMPEISIVEPGKTSSPQDKQFNAERVAVLMALRDGKIRDPRAINESLAELLDPTLTEHSTPANRKAGANHVRELLRKMKGKEQLLDQDMKLTRQGHRFIEQHQDSGIEEEGEAKEE